MPLHKIGIEETRVACRQKLETCELWLRRTIHDQLSMSYGLDYFLQAQLNGNNVINADMRRYGQQRSASNPAQYARPIDTLSFDHLINIVCKQDLYQAFQGTVWALFS